MLPKRFPLAKRFRYPPVAEVKIEDLYDFFMPGIRLPYADNDPIVMRSQAMAMYILVLIGLAAVPFFLYCLWHILRELNATKRAISALLD